MTVDYLKRGHETLDIETLHNIYTIVNYIEDRKHFDIYVWTKYEGKNASLSIEEFWESNYCTGRDGKPVSVQDIVLEAFYQTNKEFIDKTGATYGYRDLESYIMELNTTPRSSDAPIRFGFNLLAYDLAMLAYQASKPISGQPDTVMLRSFSDNIISHKSVFDSFGSDYKLSQVYKDLRYSRTFIDIQMLNEPMSRVSLKRLLAQGGYNIIESDRLSGDNAYVETLGHICDLIGYNGNDVIGTRDIFQEPEYIGPFMTKVGLLESYPDNYKNMLSADATSAKFVEHVIVPKERDKNLEIPLVDDPRINLFYPVNLEMHPDKKDLVNDFTDARVRLKTQYEEALERNPIDSEALLNIYNEQLERMNQTLDDTINARFNEDGKPPRFRYNHELGQMEEDLLEHTKIVYDLPNAVYNLYNGIRGQVNLEAARQNLYRTGVLPKNAPLVVNVPVRETNAYETYSIGGLHGEYFDYKSWDIYEKDLALMNQTVRAYNHTLAELMARFGMDDAGATSYLMMKKNGDTPSDLEHLEHKDFVTGSYKNGATWKKPKKEKPLLHASGFKKFAKTVHIQNVAHADVDSLYPTLLKNLKVFMKKLPDGTIIDVYGEILTERLRLKSLLPEDKSTWTAEHKELDRRQKRLKLLLNAASGVADASFDNNVRVNNKTLKMRICGQLILSAVVFALSDAGATVVSTNTDGVYFTGIDDWNLVEKIINHWTQYFSIGATPEIVDLFISKDSNNRLEVNDGKVIGASGGTISSYEGVNFSKALSKPVIADFLLVDQLKNRKDPFSEFDRNRAVSLMQAMIDGVKKGTLTNMYGKNKGETMTSADLLLWFQWIFTSNPSKKNFFVPYDESSDTLIAHGKVHRAFPVKDSNHRLRLITMNKQNKKTDPLAEKLAMQLDVLKLKDDGNHVAFKKHNYLPLDCAIEHHNESVTQIDISLLDRLDLDVYAGIVEEMWENWATNYEML